MQRLFLPSETISGDRIVFPDSVRHQLLNVLRLEKDDKIIVHDNSGWEYEVVLTEVDKKGITGRISGKTLSRAEARVKVRLYQGLLKGDKFELVLQKATELGVSSFVPVLFKRCVVTVFPSSSRVRRWQTIIKEAAEQSGRSILPELAAAVEFPLACRRKPGPGLIFWEEEKQTSLHSVLENWKMNQPTQTGELSVYIGPEGGIEPSEIETARQEGIIPVSLGPRVLRAETAAIASVTAVLYHLGDLGEPG
ncbi:MAG: 16S rRNA (uracil(1498)-N(3))-methyltransferase [Dehalococcoidia bacterium]|nr:16S rRNA (uracil(1498)-N(3))-methyltransferase [Dehalococcoidia bacterium]MDZ4245644.1 16S rRNA (uracil(1498)-N(3))-methyltransferase [Dehalococcoidia bacterium]